MDESENKVLFPLVCMITLGQITQTPVNACDMVYYMNVLADNQALIGFMNIHYYTSHCFLLTQSLVTVSTWDWWTDKALFHVPRETHTFPPSSSSSFLFPVCHFISHSICTVFSNYHPIEPSCFGHLIHRQPGWMVILFLYTQRAAWWIEKKTDFLNIPFYPFPTSFLFLLHACFSW